MPQTLPLAFKQHNLRSTMPLLEGFSIWKIMQICICTSVTFKRIELLEKLECSMLLRSLL